MLVLLSAAVMVFVALAGIAAAGMGTDESDTIVDESSTTTMVDVVDDSHDDYDSDDDVDDSHDDYDSDDDVDDSHDDYDSDDDVDDSHDDYDSDDDVDDSHDDYDSDDGSMPAIDDQTTTSEVSCVGSVSVEVMDGKLTLTGVDAPGWEYMVDSDWNKVKIEFYAYDSKSTIEIELDYDQFEVKIQNDSDDCHDVTADRAETFEIAAVGSVSVEVMDGKLTLTGVDAPGWEYMVDSDWNKVKIEFYAYEDKAMIEIELDDYEFKVKIETDFK